MNTKRLLLIISLAAVLCCSAAAQTPAPKPADPKDVGSLDSIMKAVYDSISGDAGKERDWDRFRSLFHPDARLIPVGKNAQTGIFGATNFSPDDYAKRAAAILVKDGFHERELARHVDLYGNIAQVFSTYHAFRKSDDKTPFLRGINSFQLLNDGKRWWVLTIYWQAETPDNAIPEKYLRSRE